MASQGRPYGLANLGNTCYLNSLLQCLNAVGLVHVLQPLAGASAQVRNPRAKANRDLYVALRKTLRVMASPGQRPVLRPQTFVETLQRCAHALGRPDFAGWGQNDVAELYTLIGQCVHESTKKEARVQITVSDSHRMTPIDQRCSERLTEFLKQEYSVAAKSLAGIEAGVVTQPNGEYLSALAETFYVLAVPVPPTASTVEDCVIAFGAESQMTGENQYRMPNPDGPEEEGDLVDAVERRIVWLAPQFLVVETRLYRVSNRRNFIQKGYERLEASNTLSLPVWSAGRETKVKYGLCAVAYHRGGSREGGHYTAVVRDRNGQKWNCNDTAVAPLSRGAQWPMGGYCFFYRKIL